LWLLGTEVWPGKMSLDVWAESFYVAQTWVELWAQDALSSWRKGHLPPPAVHGRHCPEDCQCRRTPLVPEPSEPERNPGDPFTCPKCQTEHRIDAWSTFPTQFDGLKVKEHECDCGYRMRSLYREPDYQKLAPVAQQGKELWMVYPLPRKHHTPDDVFSFKLKDMPFAESQVGSTIGGDANRLWEAGENDADAFRRRTHGELDAALDQFYESSRKIIVPADLDLKIEAAALYLLCETDASELAVLTSKRVSEDTILNWLNEAITLLDLKMKPRGHRQRLSG
jgi:hypothetical protein